MWYQKCLPQEEIFLIDNASAHPVRDWIYDDGKISCHFPSSNTSSVIDPMDQRVLGSMKGLYHSTSIQKRVYSDNEVDMKEFWGKNVFITIKKEILNTDETWNDLQIKMLQRCWNKLWPIIDSAATEGETDTSSTEREIL